MTVFARSLLTGGHERHATDRLGSSGNRPSPRPVAPILARIAVLSFTMFSAAVFAQNSATPAPANAVPAPNSAATAPLAAGGGGVDANTYIIGAQDVIFIDVFNHPELTRQHGVAPDGMISVPLVGQMQAAGLTPKQLSTQLKQALSETYNEPVVNVELIEVRSKTFTLTGGVPRPGTYPMPRPVTIFEAVNYGGGFTAYADRKKIQVIRENGDRLTFNYDDHIKGKNLDKNKNFIIENHDTIYIKD